MKSGNYAQLFADWEIGVATYWVRRYKLVGHDQEDLLQEVLIHWHQARDRHQDDRGASLRTFMNRVVENRLKEIARAADTDKRRVDQEVISDDDLELPAPATHNDLKTDLAKVLQHLTPQQRSILGLLAQDTSKSQAAKTLGIHRDTLYEEIKRIRKIFEDK